MATTNEAIAEEEINEAEPGNEVFGSPVNSVKKFGYLSDDDNESFVSADSVLFLLNLLSIRKCKEFSLNNLMKYQLYFWQIIKKKV